MEEKSHKQEMTAALRGDFERLRARRSIASVPAAAPREPAAPAVDETPQAPPPRRSFVARLRGR
jgi:hypothetical protein